MSTYSRLYRFFSKLSRPQRGFTLIELLVVSVIIVLITGTILFRQQGFNSSTILRSLAYSVALSVRQAQVYGVSVRESGVGTNQFAGGYGVSFSSAGCLGLNLPHSFQLFADIEVPGVRTANGAMDSGEELPCYRVGNGRGSDYKVKNFCAHVKNGSDACYLPASPGALTSLTIYFRRPNPDACFATSASPDACIAATTPAVYDYAYIELQAQGSPDYRTVKVSETGQITVCKLNVAAASC